MSGHVLAYDCIAIRGLSHVGRHLGGRNLQAESSKPVLRGLESSGSIKIAGSMYNLERESWVTECH
jgi:hypothetical protein